MNNAGVNAFAEEVILLDGEEREVFSEEYEINEEELVDENSPLLEDPLLDLDEVVEEASEDAPFETEAAISLAEPEPNTSTTNVTVNKTWNDNTDYSTRPDLVMTLESTTDAESSEKRTWQTVENPITFTGETTTYTWEGLPTYATDGSGKKVYYRVVETAPAASPNALNGYITTTEITDVADETSSDGSTHRQVTISITDEQKYVTVGASVNVTGDSAEYYKEIKGVYFDLYRKIKGADIFLTEGKCSRYAIGPFSSDSTSSAGNFMKDGEPVKMPQYDEKGNEYEYKSFLVSYTVDGANNAIWRDDVLGAYQYTEQTMWASAEGVKGAFAGTYTTQLNFSLSTRNIKASIEAWNDGGNQDGIRPLNVKFNVTRVNWGSYQSTQLSDEYDRTTAENASWENLPAYSVNGDELGYEVQPEDIPGYTYVRRYDYDRTGNVVMNATFTFTHTPGVTTVTASNTWNLPQEEQGNDRTINLSLQKSVEGDGTWTEADAAWENVENSSLTLDGTKDRVDTYPRETESWKASWGDLPSFTGGKRIHYRVIEETPDTFVQMSKVSESAAANSNGNTNFISNTELTNTLVSNITPISEEEALTVTEAAETKPAETKEQIEAKKLKMDSKLKVAQKSNYLSITWGKVDSAVTYKVYAAYCGNKYGNPIEVSAAKSSIKIKKIKGKKLNLKKNYKAYVEAIGSDGKVICRTIEAHVVGRKNTKYTNISGIKLKKTKVTLKKNKKYAIKGTKLILVDNSKKKLGKSHGKALRYVSSDTSVAKVSSKGVIKSVGKGECVVYVYAVNGYAKNIKVTVK